MLMVKISFILIISGLLWTFFNAGPAFDTDTCIFPHVLMADGAHGTDIGTDLAIVAGRSKDGTKAVTAYFIMGRSENSRNRVFVEEGEGIRTQAFDPAKLSDPSLIIYAPVRVLGNKTIVTNGDQTDTIYEGMDKQLTFEQSLRCK